MKGWESTSEMVQALKILALTIYFLIYFFPHYFQASEASSAFRAFHPSHPPSFPCLLRPSFIFFYYLLNKLLCDALMLESIPLQTEQGEERGGWQ